jgi:hypothetical protein
MMDATDRNTEDVLLKLRELGSCDSSQVCACPIHILLERTLADIAREREKEVRAGFEKQEEINNAKQDTDIDT